eukprot:245917-Rhodomonas_salina.2
MSGTEIVYGASRLHRSVMSGTELAYAATRVVGRILILLPAVIPSLINLVSAYTLLHDVRY